MFFYVFHQVLWRGQKTCEFQRAEPTSLRRRLVPNLREISAPFVTSQVPDFKVCVCIQWVDWRIRQPWLFLYCYHKDHLGPLMKYEYSVFSRLAAHSCSILRLQPLFTVAISVDRNTHTHNTPQTHEGSENTAQKPREVYILEKCFSLSEKNEIVPHVEQLQVYILLSRQSDWENMKTTWTNKGVCSLTVVLFCH